MKKVRVFAWLLAGIAPVVSATEPFCGGAPHAIDVDYAAEVDRSGGVTFDMREAQGRANERWDAELNRVYRDLLAALPAADQDRLRTAQRAWLAFRDAELAFAESETIAGGGTMAPLVVNDIAMGLLRDRTCALSRHRKALAP